MLKHVIMHDLVLANTMKRLLLRAALIVFIKFLINLREQGNSHLPRKCSGL